MLSDKTILITGGTGSFGKQFIKRVFEKDQPKKLIIYSRDEFKQYQLKNEFRDIAENLRFFLGDVRDLERLKRAFSQVDYVIHAAALKQVPACEYNPLEAIKTNIHGAQNVIDAAIDSNVEKVIALSTDKAVNPINLYGATKLASDKLFVAANAYSTETTFSVVRYGNVSGSRGSVIPFFQKLKDEGIDKFPITDFRMTRFWITLDEAIDLVFKAISVSKKGETYISKLPSYKIVDLAQAIHPNCQFEEIGIREGEKIHECMVTKYDSFHTYEYENYYVIYPHFKWWNGDKYINKEGAKVKELFEYDSGTNCHWLNVEELRKKIELLNITTTPL